ncbi:MAG: PAC2 family protein [Thermoplasmata archaeon]|nr:PAC2 family protein [Candidatus Sysuiplasma acidicola]
MACDVNIRNLKQVVLTDGILIESSTGVGMVAGIAASHIIASYGMDQVAAMDSDDFPPVSIVYNARPKLPSRVYCSEAKNLAIFTSEIPLPVKTHRAVASSLLKWGLNAGCRTFVSLDGIPAEKNNRAEGEKPHLWAVGTTDTARSYIERAGLEQLQTGMISGTSAIMLNEGRVSKYDVIGLFVEAREDIPDATGAAMLVQGLNMLFSPLNFAIKPLLDEAKQIQLQIEHMRKQGEPATKESYSIYG